MIRNGPKIKLNSAPGRRTTSTTSLETNAAVRVQLLSSPRSQSPMVLTALLLAAGRILALHERGKHFVERRPVFTTGCDVDALVVNLLQDPRRCRARVFGNHQQ